MKTLHEIIDETKLNYYTIVDYRNIILKDGFIFNNSYENNLRRDEFLYIINALYLNNIGYLASRDKDKITIYSDDDYLHISKNRPLEYL